MVKIHGYIGKPENGKKTRGEQFFFVNNRYIRHNYLHHAVMNAFEDLLGDESYPFYTLFIEIDPVKIDINVHPTKTEIKFEDEKTIYFIIRSAVKKALATHNITPSLDFDANVNFNAFQGIQGNFTQNSSEYTPKTVYKSGENRNNVENWEMLYSGFENPQPSSGMIEFSGEESEPSIDKFSTEEIDKKILYSDNPNIFQLHNQYIVSQVRSGMVLIDQQAAHERILYEKYLSMVYNKFGASQQFLFPQSVELSAIDFTLVMELEEEIKSLGFVFNIFGKNTIVINGIPSDVPAGSEKGLFEGLIEQFKQYKTELKLDRKENLARSLARKSALKPGTKLSVLEMNNLIEQLFACKNPHFAPNGHPTVILMDINKIAKLFNKR
jgi:DNA mismatch repair protein MutL